MASPSLHVQPPALLQHLAQPYTKITPFKFYPWESVGCQAKTKYARTVYKWTPKFKMCSLPVSRITKFKREILSFIQCLFLNTF